MADPFACMLKQHKQMLSVNQQNIKDCHAPAQRMTPQEIDKNVLHLYSDIIFSNPNESNCTFILTYESTNGKYNLEILNYERHRQRRVLESIKRQQQHLQHIKFGNCPSKTNKVCEKEIQKIRLLYRDFNEKFKKENEIELHHKSEDFWDIHVCVKECPNRGKRAVSHCKSKPPLWWVHKECGKKYPTILPCACCSSEGKIDLALFAQILYAT